MTATSTTAIQEILDASEYGEVAYRRIGFGMETWDITTPDDETTIRICDDDGLIEVYLFTNGKAMIESGRMTFRHNLAAPVLVAAMVDQIVADYA